MLTPIGWFFLLMIPLFALGMLLVKKPIHAALCFLGTLLFQGALFLELSAEFIGVMQILVYAGAILVIFVFVIVLFQDAHDKLPRSLGKASPLLIAISIAAFLVALLRIGYALYPMQEPHTFLSTGFGHVETIGQLLYVEFFFPFEAMTILFIVAAVGALYIGKKETK